MANTLAVIACEGGTASRFCSIEAQWKEPSTDQCGEISQSMFTRSIKKFANCEIFFSVFCCERDICISSDKVCDGIVHCLFLDDEASCPRKNPS